MKFINLFAVKFDSAFQISIKQRYVNWLVLRQFLVIPLWISFKVVLFRLQDSTLYILIDYSFHLNKFFDIYDYTIIMSMQNGYLINTSKAIRGSKLTTTNFIKLQLLKYRRCSPFPEQDLDLISRTISAGIDSEQLVNSINNKAAVMREKVSRETSRRLRFFQQSKCSKLIEQQNSFFNQNSIDLKTKPKTSQEARRIQVKQKGKYKTIGQQNSPELQQKNGGGKNKIVFTSNNLDRKMNDYLNYYIHKNSQSDSNYSPTSQTPQQTTNKITIHKNKMQNNFMRQMKKYRKNKNSYTQAKIEGKTMTNEYQTTLADKYFSMQLKTFKQREGDQQLDFQPVSISSYRFKQ